jgi:Kdo2-lipid IVA lauroyltransferase/acyltransferase
MSKKKKTKLRYVRYFFEAIPLYILFFFFRILPLNAASFLGGFIVERIGPLLKSHRIALKNLSTIFPSMEAHEKKRILKGMWNNLGRVVGEFPHLSRVSYFKKTKRLEIIDQEHVFSLIEQKKPVILISGHFANWEVSALGLSYEGYAINRIYRKANNIFMEALIQNSRKGILGKLVPKGIRYLPEIIKTLQDGGVLGMLVDQKLREGITVPFLGRPSKTLTIAAGLALKYNAELVPVKVERLKGACFRIQVYPPIQKPTHMPEKQAIAQMMEDVNAHMSQWILEKPEEWLWIHKRWSDIDYKNL